MNTAEEQKATKNLPSEGTFPGRLLVGPPASPKDLTTSGCSYISPNLLLLMSTLLDSLSNHKVTGEFCPQLPI